jgi:hypothetical protein
MNKRHPSILFISSMVLVLVIFGSIGQPRAATPDHGIWAELLNKHVTPGGVDYTGFKADEDRLDQYLKILEDTDSKRLSRSEQFAFYINAYNAWTIKLILSRYPDVQSIKDLGSIFKSPWEKKFVRIDGKITTLDDIEHHILRPRFKDPRVHFAINCSAASCPPLRSEPYRGDTLEQQLDDSTRSFVNNRKNYRFEGSTLHVSRIFEWFSEDFNDDVIQFYLTYAEGDLKRQLMARKDSLKVKFLHYDWSLNKI